MAVGHAVAVEGTTATAHAVGVPSAPACRSRGILYFTRVHTTLTAELVSTSRSTGVVVGVTGDLTSRQRGRPERHSAHLHGTRRRLVDGVRVSPDACPAGAHASGESLSGEAAVPRGRARLPATGAVDAKHPCARVFSDPAWWSPSLVERHDRPDRQVGVRVDLDGGRDGDRANTRSGEELDVATCNDLAAERVEVRVDRSGGVVEDDARTLLDRTLKGGTLVLGRFHELSGGQIRHIETQTLSERVLPSGEKENAT